MTNIVKRILAWIGLMPGMVWVGFAIHMITFAGPRDGWLSESFLAEEWTSFLLLVGMMMTCPVSLNWLITHGFFRSKP